MIKFTIGLTARHPKLKRPVLVKVMMAGVVGSNITLTAVSGHTLGKIMAIAPLTLRWDQFDDRPTDAFDDIIEARWAFEKLGLTV